MTYDTYLCRFRGGNGDAASLLEDGIKVEWTEGYVCYYFPMEPGCRTLVLELSCPEGTCDADVYMGITPADYREPRDLTLPSRRHLRSE
jgi:hypothetical protein